jgi:hypothetical protein
MSDPIYDYARRFVAQDWQSLTRGSRERLLRSHGITSLWSTMTWWQLAPTVQAKLIQRVVKDQEQVLQEAKMPRRERKMKLSKFIKNSMQSAAPMALILILMLSGCVSMKKYRHDTQLSYDTGKAWGLVTGRDECRDKTARLRMFNQVDENGNLRGGH